MVNLGDRVKDAITGFTGIAVDRTMFLNGSVHIGVESETLGPTGMPLYERFAEDRVATLLANVFVRAPR